MSTMTTYAVEGMTCAHCVAAVTGAAGSVEGVTGVDVDLASGLVTITSEAPLDDALVADAIGAAGYALSP